MAWFRKPSENSKRRVGSVLIVRCCCVEAQKSPDLRGSRLSESGPRTLPATTLNHESKGGKKPFGPNLIRRLDKCPAVLAVTSVRRPIRHDDVVALGAKKPQPTSPHAHNFEVVFLYA